MPFNGAGVFTRIYSWAQDEVNKIYVDATRTDTDSNDIANGLSNCITRDGQSPATANIPLGGYKITGLAVGSASTDAVNYGQVFGSPTFSGSVSIGGSATIGAGATITTGGLTVTAGGVTVSAGAVSMSAASAVTVPTAAPGDNSNKAASTAFVTAIGLSGSLPGQTGKNGRVIGTDGAAPSWVSKLLTTQVFTSSSTWVAVTDTVKVTVVGGGGGSGAGGNVCSGGAGGGTAIKTLTGLTIGGTYTVTVGLGGAAILVAGTGNAGGTSSFSGPGITTVSATGGGGGVSTGNSNAPGNGVNGDLNIVGTYALPLVVNVGDYAPGGGSYLGGGGAPGANGVGYGAGGGGVYNTTTGTAGANGVVILEY